MNCGVDSRHGLDLALLQLWHRLTDIAPIRPLALEPPYATGAAMKRQKTKAKKKKKVKCNIENRKLEGGSKNDIDILEYV